MLVGLQPGQKLQQEGGGSTNILLVLNGCIYSAGDSCVISLCEIHYIFLDIAEAKKTGC